MALAPAISQNDFSAGMCRNAPHLIPRNGAYLLQNCLMSQDGSPYRRGGTIMKSNANFGGGAGQRFLWDGILAAGRRTLFASDSAFGTLQNDDATPLSLGGSGMPAPQHPAVIDGIVFVGQTAYGGSLKSSDTSAGTADFTTGSAAVVGHSTSWTTTVDAGMLVVLQNRIYAVDSVTDNTHLTLHRPFTGTTALGGAVTWSRLATIPATYHGTGSPLWAVVANRLVALQGEDIYFSASGDSTSWDTTDNHKIAGARMLAGASLGDELFAFTTDGVWALGNMAYDETDPVGNPQHSQRQLNADMLLWGNGSGLATWENSLVIPAQDGVWVMPPAGAPRKVSRSIDPYYIQFVNAGYQPGGADVYQNHLYLPIVDAVGAVQEVLVCRLDRPVETKLGEVFPWTNWDGSGANVSAFASRAQTPTVAEPLLLGGERATGGRVLVMPQLLPDGAVKDHDAAPIVMDVIGRDFLTGGGTNTIKKLRMRYELIDAGGTAVAQAGYGSGNRPVLPLWDQVLWDNFFWADPTLGEGFAPLLTVAGGDGPTSAGDDPVVWRVNRRLRFFRPRFRCSDEASRVILRDFDFLVRPSGRQ